jgi:DNA (cytosine-5)-methyltransferase 1
MPAVAFAHQGGGAQTRLGYDPEAGTVQTLGACQTPAIAGSAVRRLTPRECERLQGFPDDYTLIPYGPKANADFKAEMAAYFERTGQYLREVAPSRFEFDWATFNAAWPRIAADGPRYKALGNSMAVPVMVWIGRRIEMVEAITEQAAA